MQCKDGDLILLDVGAESVSYTHLDVYKRQILGSADEEISTKLEIYQLSLKEKVLSTIEEIKKEHPNQFD